MGDEGKKELHKKIWVNLFVTFAEILVCAFLVYKLFPVFLPMIVAWIIAGIANPMVQFLENKITIMRKHGSVIVIVFILLLVGALLYFAIYLTITQLMGVIQYLPDMLDTTVDKLNQTLSSLHGKISFIPSSLKGIMGDNNEKLGSWVTAALNSVGSGKSISKIGSFAGKVLDGFILSILTLMLSYFFVAQRTEIKEGFRKWTPKFIKNVWDTTFQSCLRAIGGYFKACFKIMIIIFFMLFFIFGVLVRSEYAFALALLTAFLDFWPFLGAGFIIGPWTVYCAVNGEYLNVVFLIVAYLLSLLAHRLLEPKLIGDSIGMSPLATLVFMFIFYRVMGMIGLIVGVPVGMVFMALKDENVFESQIRGIKILAHDIGEYRKY